MQEVSWGVAGHGLAVAAQLLLFFAYVGYWPARLLISRGPWAPYALVLTPFVGWLLSVAVSYYLHAFLLTMTQVFWVLVVFATVGNLVVVVRRRSAVPALGDRWVIPAILAGLFLVFVAILPHAREDSLGLLALNVDEELYYPYAEHIKHYPATMDGAAEGPLLDLMKSDRFKSRGQGFAYTLSISSIVSRTPTFLAYMPTIYLLLGMSAVSVFLFARVGLGLGPRSSSLASGLYALNGLPLWFSSMGFGPHTVAFALLPLALAGIIAALKHGGTRPALFAGLSSAVLVTSYFWAISAVFLVAAVPVVLVVVLAGPDRPRRVVDAVTIGAAGAVAGFPGIFWMARWAVPQLSTITGDLNGSFGNAWGDLTFPSPETAIGLRAYHMVDDPDGMERLVGSGLWDALGRFEGVAWVGFLVLAGLGLWRMKGWRLPAWALTVAFSAFMFWVWKIAGYQYGHFKNLSYIAFFADTLLAAGLAVAWAGLGPRIFNRSLQPIFRRFSTIALRISAAGLLFLVAALTAANTIQTFRWYWNGFSWNMPAQAVEEIRLMAERVPKGATVRLSPDARYPIAPDAIKYRPITLAFHFESHATGRWMDRTAAILAAELHGRNFYTAGRTTAFRQNLDLAPANPDFYVLGSSQKPRSQGLMRHENLVPGGILALYPFAPSDTLTGQDIAGSRTGSTFFERGSPFTARVAATRISSGSGLVTSDAGRSRQVLLGVVNVERNHANVRVRAGDHSTTATLTPGLNWILLAPTPVPFELHIEPEGVATIQVFVARAFDATGSVSAGTTADPRSVVSVRASAEGDVIHTTLDFFNAALGGTNIGASYQEPATQGYWVSAARLPTDAQRMSLEYSVAEHEVAESVDGVFAKATVARESDFGGDREFELVFAHGVEKIFRFALYRYAYRDGRVVDLRVPTEPFIFEFPQR